MTIEAFCPYCLRPLEKPPERKKKCSHCENYMYVRGGNAYTEKQVKEFDFLRLWLGRPEEHYGVSEADFEDQRRELSKQFGIRAGSHDTVWTVLNTQITKLPTYPSDEHRTIYLDMASFVWAEGRDPSPHIESANKVLSGLIRESIRSEIDVFDLSPDTKWTVSTADDDNVCPSCKEAEQAPLSADEAIKDPLNCTGEHGCRCWIHSADNEFDSKGFDALVNTILDQGDEANEQNRQFWLYDQDPGSEIQG